MRLQNNAVGLESALSPQGRMDALAPARSYLRLQQGAAKGKKRQPGTVPPCPTKPRAIWTLHSMRMPASSQRFPIPTIHWPSSSANKTVPGAIRDSRLDLIRAPGFGHRFLSSAGFWPLAGPLMPRQQNSPNRFKPARIKHGSAHPRQRDSTPQLLALAYYTCSTGNL